MPLTADEADAHVCEWERRLSLPYYAHRKHWPSRLFHHAPLENAVSILTSGALRARSDQANPLHRDIAGRGVIDTRHDAHNFVRLYFRPRTPTQYHIEGIRRRDELDLFGFQAPVLVMFVFEARQILSRAGTRFSSENMQRQTATMGQDFAYFCQIPFDKVFHEGNIDGDRTIVAHRCAEVLATSPLELAGNLQWIYCRSDAERDTLLYSLGVVAEHWHERVRVSDDIRVFNKEYSYVEHVHLGQDGVTIELHPRRDYSTIAIRLTASDAHGAVVAEYQNAALSPYPVGGKRWRIAANLIPGPYVVSIWLEGELAYQSALRLGDEIM